MSKLFHEKSLISIRGLIFSGIKGFSISSATIVLPIEKPFNKFLFKELVVVVFPCQEIVSCGHHKLKLCCVFIACFLTIQSDISRIARCIDCFKNFLFPVHRGFCCKNLCLRAGAFNFLELWCLGG